MSADHSNTDRSLIYDVGLHLGEDAEFYLKKGFRVLGIEAVAGHCAQARERLRQYLDSGQLKILNVAITDRSGPTRFFVNEANSVWGTTSERWADRNRRFGARSTEVRVEGLQFASILQEFGIPHYLKVDIEGADLLCIQALKNFDSLPGYISLESTKTCWSDLCNEFALLKDLGYSKFKVVNQATVPDQVCPRPPKEGLYVDHRFAHGSSGLFGEEIPGLWLSEREALKCYRRVYRYYRVFGDESYLYRHRLGRRLMEMIGVREYWYDTHAAL